MSKIYGWEIEVSDDDTIRIIPPPDAIYVSEKYTAILLRGKGFAYVADIINRTARNIIDRRKAERDPYYNKRLTVRVRDEITAAEIRQWRKKLNGYSFDQNPLDAFLFCMSDMDTRNCSHSEDIAVLMKWLKKNPGHPFTVQLEDDR